MKKYYIITIIIFILGTWFISGCVIDQEKRRTTRPYGSNSVYCIDTLMIHGNSHEVILRSYGNLGGLMHSPECWCLDSVRLERYLDEDYIDL